MTDDHTTTSTVVNGVDLAVAESGTGEPLVLVHGSWVDRTGWGLVEEELANSYRVVSYDRRGHSMSPPAPGTRKDDEDDLAALIEHLDLAPAHIVANSLGASITLALAVRRPDLVRSVCVHEPPLLALCADDPAVQSFSEDAGRVLSLIQGGNNMEAAEAFTELVLGPGAWDFIPPQDQQIMADNAVTFFEAMQDPNWATIDTEALAACATPMLVTYGDQTPPFLLRVVDALRSSVPNMQFREIEGAGHLPHMTNVPDWLEIVRSFINEN